MSDFAYTKSEESCSSPTRWQFPRRAILPEKKGYAVYPFRAISLGMGGSYSVR